MDTTTRPIQAFPKTLLSRFNFSLSSSSSTNVAPPLPFHPTKFKRLDPPTIQRNPFLYQNLSSENEPSPGIQLSLKFKKRVLRAAKYLLAASELDKRLTSVLNQLFYNIPISRNSIENDLATENRNKLILGGANFFGMMFGIANGVGQDFNFSNLTQGQRLFVTAQALYGYGYWGPFLLELEPPHVNSGIQDLEPVLEKYAILTKDLPQVFRYLMDYIELIVSYIDGLKVLEDVERLRLRVPGDEKDSLSRDPHILQYYTVELNHSMKRALFEIVKKSVSNLAATETITLIDLYTKLLHERLDLTIDAVNLLRKASNEEIEMLLNFGRPKDVNL